MKCSKCGDDWESNLCPSCQEVNEEDFIGWGMRVIHPGQPLSKGSGLKYRGQPFTEYSTSYDNFYIEIRKYLDENPRGFAVVGTTGDDGDHIFSKHYENSVPLSQMKRDAVDAAYKYAQNLMAFVETIAEKKKKHSGTWAIPESWKGKK